MPGPCMVRVPMGHYRSVHRPVRIDIEIAGRAVQTDRSGSEQVFGSDHANDMGMPQGLRASPCRIRTMK